MTNAPLVMDDIDDTTYWECHNQVTNLVESGYIDETQFETYLNKLLLRVKDKKSINNSN